MTSNAPNGVPLKLRSSRLAQLGDVAIPAIFFGFITAFLVAMLFVEKPASRGDWWGAGVLVGICGLLASAMAIGAVALFLALFNPRVRLCAESDRVAAGDALSLSWEIDPRPDVIQELRLDLEGVHEVPPPGGGRRQQKRFAEFRMIETRNWSEIKSGKTSFPVPPDAQPSSNEASHRVIWILRVTGRIHGWPDIRDEFEITILPPRAG